MTLEEYQKELLLHDWYYHMSDDQSVYNKGYNNELALRMIAKNMEDSGDNTYRAAFNEQQSKHSLT